ncbi:hypothetical protein Nepgr_012078 [Nepenthes gracilis]|uniref:SHSP domain-containing protein n=1 Tax=Nepenthes gracilis TaxID=150966 RepID=A0AAD3SFF2_NEPGR|nr:hypothetical protein Nepgr_012078 [Nepenthes gracilis]
MERRATKETLSCSWNNFHFPCHHAKWDSSVGFRPAPTMLHVGAISRPRAGVRPVFEDFKPGFEWKDEGGSDILILNLPGFVKQQIRVVADGSRRTLTLRGERLVAGNKWSRFHEEIPVPEDASMGDIRAKFERGVLRITVPKKTPQSPAPTPSEPNEKGSIPNASVPPPPSKATIDGAKSPNVQQNLPQNAQNYLQAATDEPALKAGSEKRIRANIVEEGKEGKAEVGQQKEGNTEVEERERKGGAGEEKQTTKENFINGEMNGKGRIDEELQKKGWAWEKITTAKRRLNEEREVMVNVGVAVLVIVALGAYISYSFGSSSKSRT